MTVEREMQRRVKLEVEKAKQRAFGDLYARLDSKEGEAAYTAW